MVATSWNFIQLRKADWRDFSDPIIGEVIKQLKNAPYDPYIFEFTLVDVQVVDGAAHEIRVDFTDEFNGEATPIVLYIKGANAQDKAAGTGAQKVTIFGIDTLGNPRAEEVTLHATAATEIASTVLWKRFIGAMVTQAGSGKTNAGVIQICSTGVAQVYGTIDTDEKATIGARVYIPANYKAFLSMKAAVTMVNHATDINGEVNDGVIVAPVYSTSPTRVGLGSYFIPITDIGAGMKDLGIALEIMTGANTRYISFTQATKSDDSNQTVFYNIKVIMFGTTNSLRGLGT